ncbi:MAG: DUF2158 domain-containing protein [Acidobacteria bacterium]|nr:DUF2158 domain-containing protein [Acidobacteriota bacterium]
MENNAWKIGEIVRLKSGGPKMTVKDIVDDDLGTVECEWFSKDGEIRSAIFKADTLKVSSTLDSHGF